ncbi:hypothetical protein CHS0354_008035 [Potamilus streckersoni]|uniref:Uncharacterized protein n=1 Tax=Potamilus streckersoni TaxID=2493646 RepID=A0AAE0VU23_9BIVA|nr:hypothetical protein CHS0354_008035 [Potamilus streckersoni]
MQQSGQKTPAVSDIVRVLRSYYKPPTAEPYKAEKICCRTETTLQYDKPRGNSLENYRRRQQNFTKGYYAIQYKPYIPIGGELILDPFELAVSTLPGSLDSKAKHAWRGTVHEHTESEEDGKEQKEKPEQQVPYTKSEETGTVSPTAGFTAIKQNLVESENKVIVVSAGMPYEEHVRRMEEARKARELEQKVEEADMVIQSVSVQHLTPDFAIDEPANLYLESGFNVTSPQSSAEKRSVSPSRKRITYSPYFTSAHFKSVAHMAFIEKKILEDRIAMADNFSKAREKMMSVKRWDRTVKCHLQYLKAIYDALTAIHNMRMKDLKSKFPLSLDALNTLMTGFPDVFAVPGKGSRATYISQWHSKRQMVNSTDTVNSTSGTIGQHRSSIHSERGSVFGPFKKLNPADNVNANIRPRRRSGQKHDGRSYLETWEDLMNVQVQHYDRKMTEISGQLGLTSGMTNKFNKLYQLNTTRQKRSSISLALPATIQHGNKEGTEDLQNKAVSDSPPQGQGQQVQPQPSIPSNAHIYSKERENIAVPINLKRLPLWQQVAQEKSVFLSDKNNNIPNPYTMVQRSRRDLYTLKKSLAKENNVNMEKLKREQMANFRLKFATLGSQELSPHYELQKIKVEMISQTVTKHIETFDIKPFKWYEDLKEETLSITDNMDVEVNEMITKLQKYAHMDSKTVSLAKAKLCLYMMSLPAYEILQIYVQKALKFIFENILLGTEDQFMEWLEQRKIPYIVIESEIKE